MARILVVDDEPGLREMLTVLLRRARHEPVSVAGVISALARIASDDPYDLVITDLSMPDGTGMQVLDAARERDATTQVVMITAYATTEAAVEAMRKGAYDYIQKPFKNSELLATLDKALEKRAIHRENDALRASALGTFRLGDLIGKSEAMRRVMSLVERIASARTSVLITGESGTGKEVVARALHDRGDRRELPFVVVNCGALPEALMESELFGHEKGSFTGAATRKEGLFRAADKGTLFLDEVGELTPALQVKLLRVLQERKVRPVGGEREFEVDVRVVAATNRDLERGVTEGKFRQDLFYRLNVIRLVMPPLRDRTEDIPLLAEHFLTKHGALAGRRLSFSPEVLRWIAQQRFVGNVRELENVVERAVTLATGPRIVLADLPDAVAPPSADAPPTVVLPPNGMNLDAFLADTEHRLLLEALERAGGVRTKAAKLVGMSFRSFRYRLAKYDLGDAGDATADEGDAAADDEG